MITDSLVHSTVFIFYHVSLLLTAHCLISEEESTSRFASIFPLAKSVEFQTKLKLTPSEERVLERSELL